MSADPRYSNGNAMRKLTSWLRSQGRPCWICRAFGKSGRIDYSLPARHPYSFELDHLVPVSKWDQAGYVSAQACALDKRNVDAVHRCCNQWRGNKSVDEVLAIAKKGRSGAPKPLSLPTSRRW